MGTAIPDDVASAANFAAILEYYFGTIAERVPGDIRINGLEFELIHVGSHERPDNPKVITVRCPDGNIFVHFNGTGDGNWGYNTAAYGGPPSAIQQFALDYFDRIYERYIQGTRNGEQLFVTGHSQGGNNAKFVTLRSDNADSISNTISMDAPGFSDEFVQESRANGQMGNANKIWAFNGENDYTNRLGQEQIVPSNQVIFLECTSRALDGYEAHHIKGRLNRDERGNITLFDENGELRIGNPRNLSLLAQEINDMLIGLPQEQQDRIAYLAMKFIENRFSGAEFSSEEFFELIELLLPELQNLLLELLGDLPFDTNEIEVILRVLLGYLASGGAATFQGFIEGWLYDPPSKNHLKEVAERALSDQYAQNNPHLRVNTNLLQNYTARIKVINSRLNTLENDLSLLRTHVRFTDQRDARAVTNIISECSTLTEIVNYLENAATQFNHADNFARQIMEG